MVEAGGGDGVANRLRAFERDDPTDAEVQPKLVDVGARLRGIARETVHDAAHARAPFGSQDAREILEGIAVVEDQRQVRVACDRDLRTEHVLLRVSRAVIVIIVEAGFADRDDALVAYERSEGCGDVRRRVFGFVRMNAGRGVQIVFCSDVEGALRVGEIAADRDRRCDTRGAHTRDDGIAIGIERFVVHMRVGVDEPRDSLSLARRELR